MAMFLSRIKKALNLGTKNITVNGTYNASSDGYDGYSSVEVNVAGVTPTPITPSNVSPVALTSGSAVTPTANGYAIESYSSLSPSNSSPKSITSGNIYKASADGVAFASFTEIQPSSAYMQGVSSGDVIKIIGTSGYVMIPTQINPESSPIQVWNNGVYWLMGNGYIVNNITDKTPSDSNPPSISSGAIIKASASGYLYSSSGLKDVPTYFSGISATTNNSSGTNSVSVTSGKKYLLVAIRVSTGSASDCSITSGATVNKTYVNNTTFSGGKAKLYVVMCTATSSTITVAGTNNILSVLPLN